MRVTAFGLRMFAVILDLIASVILTLHVLFIHDKFREKPNPNSDTVIVIDEKADIERGFLIGAVVIYIISFGCIVWAEQVQNSKLENRLRKLEHTVSLEHPKEAEIFNSEGTEAIEKID